MNNKKNIDDLFKEQLQHFEAAPSPAVWNNIEAQLKKEKEDRKVIPIWWKLAGVAAVLALLLTANAIFDPFGNRTSPTLVEGNPDAERSIETKTSPIFEEQFKGHSISIENVNEAVEEDITTKQKDAADQEKSLSNFKQNDIATEQKQEAPTNNKAFKTPIQTTKDAVATSSEESNKKTLVNTTLTPFNETTVSKEISNAVASEKVENPKPTESQNPNFKTNISESNKINDSKVATIENNSSQRSENESLENNKTIVPDNKVTQDAVAKVAVPNLEKVDEKKSIFDAIEEEKEAVIAQQEEKDLKNWEVTPNFGPVFYNSIDGGSSIDPSFADNTQNTETNFSYGVQISYAVSPRLKIRSGVSNVNLGYTTEGLELATGPSTAALQSINYGSKQTVTTAVDKGSFEVTPPTNGMNPFDNLRPKSTGGNATLTQNLSYYEIPLELNYALLDTRFGVNMIGGFSTLLLGDNEVVANDGDFREVLGGANNLNSVSFSTNVGLGFHYKISQKLKFNIEPMFKYQLNPYADSSVDFKPYYLGVYSGLSFKF